MNILIIDKNLPKTFNRQELFFGDIEEYKSKLKKYWCLESGTSLIFDDVDILDKKQKEIVLKALKTENANEMFELLKKYNLNLWDNEDADLNIITDKTIIEKRECERTLREILTLLKDKIDFIAMESDFLFFQRIVEDIKIEQEKEKTLLLINNISSLNGFTFYLDDEDLDKISFAESKTKFKFNFKKNNFILGITLKNK